MEGCCNHWPPSIFLKNKGGGRGASSSVCPPHPISYIEWTSVVTRYTYHGKFSFPFLPPPPPPVVPSRSSRSSTLCVYPLRLHNENARQVRYLHVSTHSTHPTRQAFFVQIFFCFFLKKSPSLLRKIQFIFFQYPTPTCVCETLKWHDKIHHLRSTFVKKKKKKKAAGGRKSHPAN